MNNSFIAAMALASSIMMGACWSNQGYKMENTFRMIEVDVDSTIYGTCLLIQGNDSMFFLTDMGDSVWFDINRAMVCGKPDIECQLALMLHNDGTVKKLINITALMGTWVEPDPIDEGYEMGISLLEGGYASSVNSRVHNYTNWSFHNGLLLLTSCNDIGRGVGENIVDTFDIMVLDKDSLIMRSSSYDFHYSHPSDSVRPESIMLTGDSTDYMDFVF